MVFSPKVHQDRRGSFLEGHRINEIAPHIKSARGFVQSCVSASGSFVLRGLHYQLRKDKISPGQGKLIRCVAGKIYQVSVDMRENSPTRGQWVNQILDDKLFEAVWVPPGFANGFMAFERGAVVHYEMTEYFDEKLERNVLWSDQLIGITWPGGPKTLSPKDKNAPRLDAVEFWK